MRKRLVVIALSLLVFLSMFCITAMAEDSDYGERGMDAHSESMAVEPDESALIESGLADEVEADVDIDTEDISESEDEEEKGGFKMNSTIMAAMIAAGVTIVVCEIIKSKINK